MAVPQKPPDNATSSSRHPPPPEKQPGRGQPLVGCGPRLPLLLLLLFLQFFLDGRRLLAVLGPVLGRVECLALRLADETLGQRPVVLVAPVALLLALGSHLGA